MNVAFHTAVHGVLFAQAQASTAANNVVVAASKGEDIIQDIVAMKQAEAMHTASATMVKVASDMTDSLLDIIV
jgi:predicted transcriptional regulator